MATHQKEICMIKDCKCEQDFGKIYDLQERMLADKFYDLFDSILTYRLHMMKEIGINYDDSIYDDAYKFFNKCFKKSIKKYFIKEVDKERLND